MKRDNNLFAKKKLFSATERALAIVPDQSAEVAKPDITREIVPADKPVELVPADSNFGSAARVLDQMLEGKPSQADLLTALAKFTTTTKGFHPLRDFVFELHDRAEEPTSGPDFLAAVRTFDLWVLGIVGGLRTSRVSPAGSDLRRIVISRLGCAADEGEVRVINEILGSPDFVKLITTVGKDSPFEKLGLLVSLAEMKADGPNPVRENRLWVEGTLKTLADGFWPLPRLSAVAFEIASTHLKELSTRPTYVAATRWIMDPPGSYQLSPEKATLALTATMRIVAELAPEMFSAESQDGPHDMREMVLVARREDAALSLLNRLLRIRLDGGELSDPASAAIDSLFRSAPASVQSSFDRTLLVTMGKSMEAAEKLGAGWGADTSEVQLTFDQHLHRVEMLSATYDSMHRDVTSERPQAHSVVKGSFAEMDSANGWPKPPSQDSKTETLGLPGLVL